MLSTTFKSLSSQSQSLQLRLDKTTMMAAESEESGITATRRRQVMSAHRRLSSDAYNVAASLSSMQSSRNPQPKLRLLTDYPGLPECGSA